MKTKNGSFRPEKIGSFNELAFIKKWAMYTIIILISLSSCNKRNCSIISDSIVQKSFEFVLINPDYSNYFMNEIFVEKNSLIDSINQFEVNSFGDDDFDKRSYKIDNFKMGISTNGEYTKVSFNKYTIYDGNSLATVEFSAYPCNMTFELTFAKNEKGEWLCVENKAIAISEKTTENP